MGASGQTRSALPCRPGNSLVAQGEVPSIGNGTMRQVFFTAEGIFFRAIADFPALGGKRSCLPDPGRRMSQHIFILVLAGHFFTSIRKDDRTTGVRRGIALRNMDMPFCKAQISRRPFPVCGTGLLSRDHPRKGWHTVCPAPRPPPATSREASQNKNACWRTHSVENVFCLPRPLFRPTADAVAAAPIYSPRVNNPV